MQGLFIVGQSRVLDLGHLLSAYAKDQSRTGEGYDHVLVKGVVGPALHCHHSQGLLWHLSHCHLHNGETVSQNTQLRVSTSALGDIELGLALAKEVFYFHVIDRS